MKYFKDRLLVHFLIALAALAAVSASIFINPAQTSAVSGSQWQPGYIIDDSLFFSPNMMGANDIQTFLSAKVPTCDTNHGGGGPYTCLKDYTQYVTPTSPDAYCSYGISEGTKSAAMIISEVAWACGINPQVLIVLLQKEQALITDTWPTNRQYQFATGFCVFDSGSPPPSCEGTDGFFRQVYYAARQFQRYVKQPLSFNYRAGQTSFISYQANNPGCSGSNVYIQNGATAALYNYTPYQPNQAALNNLYGEGDGCSAYGNRNFWRMFNDWFGPTMGSLVKTANDNTVYLLNGTQAHPIYDQNVLNDYAALGPVRTTNATEINTHSSGSVLSNMVGDANGTLYLVNSSIKLPFSSCDSVADYRFSCGQVTYLNPLLLNKLQDGPGVTPLLMSSSGGTVYYVTGGSKRAILSWDELLRFGIPVLNVLSNSFVGQIPTNGIPAHGPGTLVKTANSPTVYIVKDINNLIPTSNFIYPQELGFGLGVRTIASTYSAIGLLENKIKCNGANYIASNGAKHLVSDVILTRYNFNAGNFIDGGLLCRNVENSSIPLERYIRVSSGSIYYVSSGQKQAFTSYDSYLSHGGTSSNTSQVSDFFAGTIPSGPPL